MELTEKHRCEGFWLDGHLGNLPSDKAVVLDDGVSSDLESIEKKNLDQISFDTMRRQGVVLGIRGSAEATINGAGGLGLELILHDACLSLVWYFWWERLDSVSWRVLRRDGLDLLCEVKSKC